MNIKKIGLTALAASLVSVSAHAGSLTAAGGASMNMEGHTGNGLNAGTTFSMGDSVTLTGSGELDNGLTVSVSFELDGATNGTSDSFDAHSVSISSEELGTLTLSGHAGNSATTAIDTTAAGDMWDNFDQLSNDVGVTFPDLAIGNGGENDSFFYSSPDLGMGVTFVASYDPQASGAESQMGYGINYTGVEGLTLNWATSDEETGTANTSGDNTALKASYAYGPVTVTYSSLEHDEGLSTGANDIDMTSYAISYTVSDELSLTYGSETSEKGSTGNQDAEIDGITVAYTAGGMTITAKMIDGENLAYGTSANEDVEYWKLGASFAF